MISWYVRSNCDVTCQHLRVLLVAVPGAADTAVVCCLYPSWKEILNFIPKLVEIEKRLFPHPSSQMSAEPTLRTPASVQATITGWCHVLLLYCTHLPTSNRPPLGSQGSVFKMQNLLSPVPHPLIPALL